MKNEIYGSYGVSPKAASATTAAADNPLTMDGFVFPDKKSLDAYKKAKG